MVYSDSGITYTSSSIPMGVLKEWIAAFFLKEGLFTYQEVLVNTFEQCFTVDIRFLNSDLVWLTIVDGNCSILERQLLCKKLFYCPETYKDHQTVVGDFNAISDVSDKLGSRPPNLVTSEEFNPMINGCSIIDYGYKGSKYIWSNNQEDEGFVWENYQL